uniref:Ribosomal protein S2 n=1 Tax=Malawimonas californiana TaxID=221722 RepID=A0A0B5GMU5_MALCL|nr:ribosomal protein S2 [Malawimonas californiana]AJF22868.1 ribosomal protein S2 [Malawimonas californiana]
MNNKILKQLASLSSYIGHSKSIWNPQMENYLFGHINGIHILNIEKTVNILQKDDFNNESNKYVQYIQSSQLLNGSLSNLITLINNYKNLKKEHEITENITLIRNVPDVIVIFNINHKHAFINEAISLKIPVISLVDSNNNPNLITYPLPSNNQYNPVISYFIDYIKKIINIGVIENLVIYNRKYKLYKNIKKNKYDI